MKKITNHFDAKVLVVDDYLINLELTKQLLELMACEVDTAANGLEALEQMKDNKYDLIFMDIQMPEMDGVEATKEIRKKDSDENRHTPIIALTAHAIQGDREKYLNEGMDDYLSKPITGSDLEKILIKYLKN